MPKVLTAAAAPAVFRKLRLLYIFSSSYDISSGALLMLRRFF
jgi:hypothetical protein